MLPPHHLSALVDKGRLLPVCCSVVLLFNLLSTNSRHLVAHLLGKLAHNIRVRNVAMYWCLSSYWLMCEIIHHRLLPWIWHAYANGASFTDALRVNRES